MAMERGFNSSHVQLNAAAATIETMICIAALASLSSFSGQGGLLMNCSLQLLHTA
jgi:hypothetical protein